MTASQGTGDDLDESELQKLVEGCDVLIELDNIRQQVLFFLKLCLSLTNHFYRFSIMLKVE